MLPTKIRNSERARARWSGRCSAAKSKSSILPRTARLPATPRRRRTWATTLRRLIFTNPISASLSWTGLPASPAWINLDETTQIGLDQMFAGGPAIQDSANTAPQLIRFAAKANNVEYEYVAQNWYYTSSNVKLATAIANNKKAYAASPPVAPPPPPLGISFMPGRIEIKSAWRPLNAYDNPARFHVRMVRFYEGLPKLLAILNRIGG